MAWGRKLRLKRKKKKLANSPSILSPIIYNVILIIYSNFPSCCQFTNNYYYMYSSVQSFWKKKLLVIIRNLSAHTLWPKNYIFQNLTYGYTMWVHKYKNIILLTTIAKSWEQVRQWWPTAGFWDRKPFNHYKEHQIKGIRLEFYKLLC